MSRPFLPAMILTLLLGLAALSLLTSPLFAKNRPTDLIAADLGVTESEFIACFQAVRPAKDHAPSGAHQRMNKAVLLPCLQEANAEITNAKLDSVMDRYRPEGPMRK